ncbi:MAG: metallophosphoesterase [Candidatus Anammoxibacter sp.]
MKIFATSDIHGNKALIYRVFELLKSENIDALVIAGDVTSKGFYRLCNYGT